MFRYVIIKFVCIILIIPKVTTPTTSIPPTGVPGIPGASELPDPLDSGLDSGFNLGNFSTVLMPEFKIPIVTVDTSEIETLSNESETVEESPAPGDVYVDLTDSNSSDLIDINFESGDICTLPYFFLSYSSYNSPPSTTPKHNPSTK